jgi:hypothetical protein
MERNLDVEMVVVRGLEWGIWFHGFGFWWYDAVKPLGLRKDLIEMAIVGAQMGCFCCSVCKEPWGDPVAWVVPVNNKSQKTDCYVCGASAKSRDTYVAWFCNRDEITCYDAIKLARQYDD